MGKVRCPPRDAKRKPPRRERGRNYIPFYYKLYLKYATDQGFFFSEREVDVIHWTERDRGGLGSESRERTENVG